MKALAAASTAAIHPARSLNSVRPAHQATGTLALAKTSERTRVADSEVPNTLIQKCRSS